MPIRFNGSIFTVDGIQPNNGINYGPDYRAWGSAYLVAEYPPALLVDGGSR